MSQLPTAPSLPPSASVRADEVLTVVELCRRLRWRGHSLRQAKRLGLPTIRFGARDYAIGDEVLTWFKSLAQRKSERDEP